MNSNVFLRTLFNFGIPASMIAGLIILIKSFTIVGNDLLSLAITIDLLFTVPIVYFLLIRKTKVPKTTVVPIILIGLLVGSVFLPKESQTYLSLFKTWILPFIEIGVLAYIGTKVYGALKTYKVLKEDQPDFYEALKSTCYELLPKKIVPFFISEISVIYYGFINWKTRQLAPNEFSYHKKSGTPAIIGAFILVIVVETFAIHLLVERWNTVIAWILSGLSIYTIFQLIGFARSLSKRPISILNDKLVLRYGIMNETTIPLDKIDRVELSRKPLNNDELTKRLSLFGELESHNVIIFLNEESILEGLYGIKKKFTTIGLHLDTPQSFKDSIETKLNTEQ